jgi:hypothetical protein
MAEFRRDLLFFLIQAGGEDGMITKNTRMWMMLLIFISLVIPLMLPIFWLKKEILMESALIR